MPSSTVATRPIRATDHAAVRRRPARTRGSATTAATRIEAAAKSENVLNQSSRRCGTRERSFGLINDTCIVMLSLSTQIISGEVLASEDDAIPSSVEDAILARAARLTPDDVSAVSAWLAAQRVAPGARAAAQTSRPMPLACGGTDRVR